MNRTHSLFTGLLAMLLLIFAGGCDIIEDPYYEPEYLESLNITADEQCLKDAQASDPFAGVTIEKKVFLEEMTGHKCGNCPAASDRAYEIYHDLYPGRVVFMGIHAGSLATFSPAASKFYTNFTTPTGDEIYGELNDVGGVPYGMIDRVHKTNNSTLWRGQVEEQLAEAPEAGLSIFNCYNADSSTFTTVVDVKTLTDLTENEYLSLFLVEDQIIDWQKDYRTPSKIDYDDYVHHFVLRGAINGTWGSRLSEEAIAADTRFTEVFSAQINADHDVNNLYVIALIYQKGSDEQVVRQVEIAPLVN
ncbi:Omp28-related outer membrane protein [Pontibacter sp. G13]|uniref:Omp28-related outer membrane protein n=1 Tax=Pontibacter sp. G13 TaxID=3074898 RepID=UPI0028890C48|nr:Omp28-related outer membrane protein [Pontibacter sp. G13]WNJ16632.1 Omp28-related outer membrane protein [Pontibacter sp. G13]